MVPSLQNVPDNHLVRLDTFPFIQMENYTSATRRIFLMRYCEINKHPIDCSKITVDHHSFGKSLPSEEVNFYFLKIEFSDAIIHFSKYYQDFIDRESEDEGFYEELEGDYKYLHDTGYISFEKMLKNQSELLSRVLLKILPSEFMGYLFNKKQKLIKKFIYFKR